MSSSQLPEHASLEYLKKLAKERLHALRRTDPHAKLAAALLSIAREYGFPSWRALKAELDARQTKDVVRFFNACAAGDSSVVREMLDRTPELVRAANPEATHDAWTGLHSAAKGGHLEVVRLLLDRGADPNAREAGDNTYPLHWAAAAGHVDIVRALLDAGGDVHGVGDVHLLDAIGWASFYHAPGDDPTAMDPSRRPLLELLTERGARHHLFSAMSVGDPDLIQKLVEENPEALDRRMSRFEHGLTPLHFAMQRKRYDLLDLLIELGADVDAQDAAGRTPLAVAMLHGDGEAMRRLHAAGAKPPETIPTSSFTGTMAKLAASTKKGVAMIHAPDVARALDWYTSIGFKEIARYSDDGVVNFGMVSFGRAEVMINMDGKKGRHDASLWLYTDEVDEIYRLLKARQLEAARASLAGESNEEEGIQFQQDIEDMFYGARQFCIRDLNGYELYFIKSIEG